MDIRKLWNRFSASFDNESYCTVYLNDELDPLVEDEKLEVDELLRVGDVTIAPEDVTEVAISHSENYIFIQVEDDEFDTEHATIEEHLEEKQLYRLHFRNARHLQLGLSEIQRCVLQNSYTVDKRIVHLFELQDGNYVIIKNNCSILLVATKATRYHLILLDEQQDVLRMFPLCFQTHRLTLVNDDDDNTTYLQIENIDSFTHLDENGSFLLALTTEPITGHHDEATQIAQQDDWRPFRDKCVECALWSLHRKKPSPDTVKDAIAELIRNQEAQEVARFASDDDVYTDRLDNAIQYTEVGYSGRGFAIRSRNDAPELAVYKRANELGEVESVGVIHGDKFFYKENQIKPLRTLLADSEQKMLLQERNKIYEMDLEKEMVIREYDGGPQLKTIFPLFAGAQKTQTKEFFGLSEKEIYRYDASAPNRKGPKKKQLGVSSSKIYKTNPSFSSATTSSTGNMLVGSTTGILRCYDGGTDKLGNLKRSKNNIETDLLDLTNVKFSNKNDIALIASDNRILVFPTTNENGDIFTSVLKRDLDPLELRIPEDLAAQTTDRELVPARFVHNSYDEVTAVVSAAGNLLLAWDYKHWVKTKIIRCTLIQMLSKVYSIENDPETRDILWVSLSDGIITQKICLDSQED